LLFHAIASKVAGKVAGKGCFVKLSPRYIKEESKPGTYGDGDGLYLQIAKSGSKSWIYRYQINKHRRWLGLGGFPGVSLAKARKEKDRYKLSVKAGIDPIQEKEANKTVLENEKKKGIALKQTFSLCAEAYIESKEPEWKNRKHVQQWRNTLKTYASPVIGELPTAEIDLDHILQVLNPIWLEKTETATRVRNRIELVLDYATVKGYRSGQNPARWRGNLDKLLPKPSKIKKVKHHPALPYEDIPAFMATLNARKELAAKALVFTILTAARTSESLGATWDEIDLEKNTWVIPASRMKVEKEHRIPLSVPVIALLGELKADKKNQFIFPGLKRDKPLSNMAMANVLKRMERPDLTVHGFRSTFRDWVAERTNFPQRVAETALAHRLKDGAEAAYQRGDLLEKRKELMEVWADYCQPKTTNVARIRA